MKKKTMSEAANTLLCNHPLICVINLSAINYLCSFAPATKSAGPLEPK